MAEQEAKVVVDVNLSNDYYEELERWVARIKGLGITAYRRTEDEAAAIATDMFAEEIQVHRELGNLELWLNKMGVEWCWEGDFVEQGDREYMDVSISSHRLPLLASSETCPTVGHNPTREYALVA